MQTKREWALYLASKGFKILRCYANTKVPKDGYSWKKQMTSNPKRINELFDAYPDMNYGVCPAGVGVIIDLDIKGERNGLEYLKNLEQEHDSGIYNRTFMVESPSGGIHLYLLIDEEVGNANNFDKAETAIDVRGWGGYVIGPGCTIANANELGEEYENEGEYRVTNDSDMIQCPNWIRDNYLKKPGKRDKNAAVPLMDWDMPVNIAKATDYLRTHPPAVQGQHGDSHTYELAAQIRDFGVSEDKCIELMFSSGWNDRCVPPWPLDELESVVENAYRYAENRPGEKADFLGMAMDSGIYDSMMEEVAQHEAEKRKLPRYTFDEWINRGNRSKYLVPNWIPAHGMTAVNAIRGTGKSTIFLDLALRIASDMDWHDIQISKGHCVIYLCGEDDEGLELNTVGWVAGHPEADLAKLKERILFYDGTPNLMSADDVKTWFEDMHEFVAGRPVVIFLDTWQRGASRAGQNKDEDMQLCVHHVEKLGESLGGPVIAAFHPPKHNEHTILGSSIIENSTTAIIEIRKVAEGIKAEVTRIKGTGTGSYGIFHFDQFEIDEKDEYGHKRKVIVPRRIGGTEEDGTDKAREDFESVRHILARLIRAWIMHNESLPEEERIPPEKYNRFNISMGIDSIHKREDIRTKYIEPLARYGIKAFSRASIDPVLKQYFFEGDPGREHFRDVANRPVTFENNTTLGLNTKGKILVLSGVPNGKDEDYEDVIDI